MYYYHNAYALNQYFANNGYIVLSINYRSGIGYGLDFREALHYGPSGGSEYNDVQGAGVYLRGRSDVDAARIGAWGGSYGGYLVAMALARASGLFRGGRGFPRGSRLGEGDSHTGGRAGLSGGVRVVADGICEGLAVARAADPGG